MKPVTVVDPTIALVIKAPHPITTVKELKAIIDAAIDRSVPSLKHPVQTIHITGNMSPPDPITSGGGKDQE
jgi:hypothetical protein